jgi:mannitol/fructose-specific phosphotransferase system IIA component (Ntr-type)
MKLSDLLKPEYVKIGLNSKTKEDIMQEIAEFISVTHKSIDKKDAYAAIKERERKGSTGVGNGLAIPHGRSPRIDGIHLVAIYDPDGKDFDAYDKKPSHLFFGAVTSDEYSPHEQLEVLRLIAEIHEKTDIGKALMRISSNEDFYKLILKKEEEIS